MKASDNAHVTDLVCEFAQSYLSNAGLHYDLDTAHGVIAGLQNHGDASIWVVDVAGGLRGVGAVVVMPAVFNQHILVAHELIWYVQPDWRHKDYGVQLFDAMEAWSIEKGVHIVQGSYPMQNTTVATFYKARGYVPMDCLMIRVL